jgi:hypothetical protein
MAARKGLRSRLPLVALPPPSDVAPTAACPLRHAATTDPQACPWAALVTRRAGRRRRSPRCLRLVFLPALMTPPLRKRCGAASPGRGKARRTRRRRSAAFPVRWASPCFAAGQQRRDRHARPVGRARRLSLADQQDWSSRVRFLREQLNHLFVDLTRQRKGFVGFLG